MQKKTIFSKTKQFRAMVSIDKLRTGSRIWAFQTIHYWTSKIQDGGNVPSWKVDMRSFFHFFCRARSDLDNISQTGAEWHVDCGDMVEIETGSRIPIWQMFVFENGNSYISATNWVITMKFVLLIETDIRKQATSSDLKLEVKLRRRGRHLEIRYDIISPVRMDRFGQNSTA